MLCSVGILGMLIVLAWSSVANSWPLLIHPALHNLTLNFLLPDHPLLKYFYKMRGKKALLAKTCYWDLQIPSLNVICFDKCLANFIYIYMATTQKVNKGKNKQKKLDLFEIQKRYRKIIIENNLV